MLSPYYPLFLQWDHGYREYSAIPWQDRVNPWAGNEVYEDQMRRAYLRRVAEENRELAAESRSAKTYYRALDRYEHDAASNDVGLSGRFFNKDTDKDKWARGMHLGHATPTVAGNLRHGNPGLLEINDFKAPASRPGTANPVVGPYAHLDPHPTGQTGTGGHPPTLPPTGASLYRDTYGSSGFHPAALPPPPPEGFGAYRMPHMVTEFEGFRPQGNYGLNVPYSTHQGIAPR